MCKKLGITALLVVAALFTLHKLDLLGYGKVAWKKARDEARSSVPPEVKIERLKQEIAQLAPDMNQHRRAIAQEMVEVEKLKRKIADARESLAEQEKAIRSVKAKLDQGKVFVTSLGKEIPRSKVEADLASQWETHQQAKSSIQSQEELLQIRLDNLELAKQKLTLIKAKKEELEVKVAQLESELRKVRMAQTKANHIVDDSQLKNVLRLYEEIDTQIAKEKTELDMQKADLIDSNAVKTEAERLKVEKALKEMDERFADTKVADKK